jgi:hypothetical protein
MVVVVAVVALIAIWKFATRIDRSNPVAVATAFTKALKAQDIGGASKFYVPDQAEAWREKTDGNVQGMRSGSMDRFFERIPAAPDFATPVTVAGKSMVVSADKGFSLEMTQVDGKWYVAKTDF